MQELSLQTQITLIEIKARYSYLFEELDAVFGSAYLKQTGTREKLALKMITEIKNVLNDNPGGSFVHQHCP